MVWFAKDCQSTTYADKTNRLGSQKADLILYLFNFQRKVFNNLD